MGISDHQYDTGLVVYYATYIASEIPSNLVLKRISPRVWLPVLTVAWGIVTMCLGFVKNYAGFMTVRAILGLTEGGLLPGIVSYLEYRSLVPLLTVKRSYTCQECTQGVRWP